MLDRLHHVGRVERERPHYSGDPTIPGRDQDLPIEGPDAGRNAAGDSVRRRIIVISAWPRPHPDVRRRPEPRGDGTNERRVAGLALAPVNVPRR